MELLRNRLRLLEKAIHERTPGKFVSGNGRLNVESGYAIIDLSVIPLKNALVLSEWPSDDHPGLLLFGDVKVGVWDT